MAKPLVLVVEKDSEKRAQIVSYLENYLVLEASDYASAKHLVKINFLKLRIILSSYYVENEIVTPFIDYVSKLSNVPRVIVYSEKLPVNNVVTLIKGGAYDYMVEPLTLEKVQQIVSTSIDCISQLKRDDDIDVFSQFGLQERVMKNLQISKCHREGKTVNTEDMITMCPELQDQSNMDITKFQEEFFNISDTKLNTLRKAKVLVVEDEDVYCDMLTQLLSGLYDVHSAGTGEAALNILKSEKNIDVVLLDIFLPDVTGDDLISHIKSINSKAEIIILTAYERVDKAVKSLKSGAFEYINKPVLKSDLLEAVSRALDRRYQQSIYPEFSKKFLLNILSDDVKLTMLDQHCRSKLEIKSSVLMKDIYMFFPELKDTFIPDSLVVPKSVIESDVRKFVCDLKKQVVPSN
jgi:DNA-binding NtrC family response regulator